MKASRKIPKVKVQLKNVNHVVSKLGAFYERRTQNIDKRFSEGSYYRIIVRPREDFKSFKSETPTINNTIQQINGKNAEGQWSTQSWLIHKDGAHIDSGKLVPDNKAVRRLLQVLDGHVVHIKDDVFQLVN
jgi:hypothetical protein